MTVTASERASLEELGASELLAWAAERFQPRLGLASSFQKEEAVLIDLLMQVAPDARIFTLDTGVLFPETYAVWRAVEERYGITVEPYRGTWIDGLWATEPEWWTQELTPVEEPVA